MTDDLERRLPFERMLSDLLAIIHRDGGHRQDEVGCEQAWMEAMMMVPPMLDAADEIARLRAENEALRKERETLAQNRRVNEAIRPEHDRA